MSAKFYTKTVDGESVDYFRFEFSGQRAGDVHDAPATDTDKRNYPREWAAYEAGKRAASAAAPAEEAPGGAEEKGDDEGGHKDEGGEGEGDEGGEGEEGEGEGASKPKEGDEGEPADEGEKILQARERAAGRKPKK